MAVLAADLGGTKCRVARVDAAFNVHDAVLIDTVMDRSVFLEALDAAVVQVLAGAPKDSRPTACGVGTAGLVGLDGSTIGPSPNVPLGDFNLGAHLASGHGLDRVVVLNDGRASALGESLRGAAKGKNPLLALFFGTGIGIGMVFDGKSFAGAGNAAGEIGHTPYIRGGRTCVCGRAGCYEAYCGGRAIEQRGREAAPGATIRGVGDVLALAAEGHAGAQQVLAEAEAAAGALVAGAATLLNPGAVVLGGGLVGGWSGFAERVEASAREWVSAAVSDSLVFERSMGGSDAILWGAAAAAGCQFEVAGEPHGSQDVAG